MSTTASLCLLLMCTLVVAPTRAEGQDGARNPANFIPVEEWTEEHIEAVINAKDARAKKGKTYEVVKSEIDFLNRVSSKHVRDGNCGAIVNLNDPSFMLISADGTIISGLEAFKFMLQGLEDTRSTNVTSISVSPLGKNARFVFQHARFTSLDREGNPYYGGETFLIWKRHPEYGLRLAIEAYDEEEMTV